MGAIRLQVIPGLAWGVRAKMKVSTVTSRAARSQSHQGACPCRIWNPGKQPVVFQPVKQLENGCMHCLTLHKKQFKKIVQQKSFVSWGQITIPCPVSS